MRRHEYVEAKQGGKSFPKHSSEFDKGYDSKQISNIIKRYQELRSTVELTSTRYERISGGDGQNGKEELICTLIDIDSGIAYLSKRQQTVIQMLENGFCYEEISCLLKISVHTVKFHAQQGIYRITAYLNTRRRIEDKAL